MDVITQKPMPPRKSNEDVMIKFCKSQEEQKQSFPDVPNSFQSFTGKNMCWSLF